jgi:aminoglycoside phosphotransferase (APT) family kinase protein
MLPSELRLLRGIHDALDRLAKSEANARSKASFGAIGVALNELLLRNNHAFFVTYYAEALVLAGEGLALATADSRARLKAAVAALPQAVTADLHMDALGANLERLSAALADLVRCIYPSERQGSAQAKEYLARIVDWENRLHAYRLTRAEDPATAAAQPASQFSVENIAQYLRGRFPEWGSLEVSNLQLLTGGFSKATVLFDVEAAIGGRQSLVIRAEQPMSLLFLDGAKVANEFFVLKLARELGMPVAEPLWLEKNDAALGSSFLVSRKAPGRNFGTAVSVDDKLSEGLLQDLMAHLVRIHATRIDPHHEYVRQCHLSHWLQFRTLTDSTAALVAFWRDNVARLNLPASPSRTRIFEWLAANVPQCDEPPSFIHCDYGLHNILVENNKVACILDWEGASIGDPAEDFVWFADALRGQADRSHLLDLYVAAGGQRIPEFRLKYFDVFRSLKYAVVCPTALTLFEAYRAVDVAACQLGLLYPYYGSSELNQHINAADKARSNLVV